MKNVTVSENRYQENILKNMKQYNLFKACIYIENKHKIKWKISF